MHYLLKTLVFAAALAVPLSAQAQLTFKNLGGASGGAIGYPLTNGSWTDFLVARPTCGNVVLPIDTVIVNVGLRQMNFPITFNLFGGFSIAPGAVWHVDQVVLAVGSGQVVLGNGTYKAVSLGTWPVKMPVGAVVYLQATVACAQITGTSIALTDAWSITSR